ncbi:MAG: hypothetical protein BWY43_00624 [candidate division WS2 bacterium ADurb.Bin280]|uniref:Mannosyltransferase n=1 Tax=candidate division WS2 bacterium ADurb.Bin280 TaxID=1852829 RepID=A0A1V5SCB0_9BACT|nr:MAG: hypothetical protein BWY43_00624 [candidate division WS2 bacterium ADurb.Bin280]
MKINSCIFLIVSVFLSLFLRVYFLNKSGYLFDINCFLEWGGKINESGFWSLFGGDYYQDNGIDYPPLVPLICSWWFSLVSQPTVLFYKILPTIFELGLIGINSYYILKSNFKFKNLLLFVVIVQPALGLVTSAWGQVDSIMALLILSGFIFWEKNFFLASLLLFLSFLAKPQAVIAIFIYFLSLLFRKNKRDFFVQGGFWLLLFALMILIFHFFGGSNFFDPYTTSVGRYTNLSLNAFNLWWLIFKDGAWSMNDTLGPYKAIGLSLFAVFHVPVLIFAIRRKINLQSLLMLTSYSYLIFFVFPTQIHERYLFPSLALLTIPSAYSNLLFAFYIALSATFFYNCFAVLQSVYPQFDFVSENLLRGDFPVAISFINVLTAIFFAYYLINESFGKNQKK